RDDAAVAGIAVVADGQFADGVHLDAVHAVHAPRQADQQPRAGLVLKHAAKAADDSPLAGAHLHNAGQQIETNQGNGDEEEEPAHYLRSFFLPGAGGAYSRSKISRCVESNSVDLPSPSIFW